MERRGYGEKHETGAKRRRKGQEKKGKKMGRNNKSVAKSK
jgi:hypothetical protein